MPHGMDQHKVALVTGAARGLGRAIAEALLQRGLKVCIADVLTDVGRVATQELQAQHGADNVLYAACDVTNQDQFRGAWDACTEVLGEPDLLVNNAGIGNEQNWRLTLDVNVGGCITGTLLALEKLGKGKDGQAGGRGGRVVNISSIAGVKTIPLGPIYSATKYAIVGFSRALGSPLHYSLNGVKVQCLCPALIQTTFLKESLKTAFTPAVGAVTLKVTSAMEIMPTSEVAAALVKLIDEGPNGGVMVVEPSKEPYYVDASVPA